MKTAIYKRKKLQYGGPTKTPASDISQVGNTVGNVAGVLGGMNPWVMGATAALTLGTGIASAVNYKPQVGKEKHFGDYLAETGGNPLNLIPELIKMNKDKNTVVSGSPGSYRSGGRMKRLIGANWVNNMPANNYYTGGPLLPLPQDSLRPLSFPIESTAITVPAVLSNLVPPVLTREEVWRDSQPKIYGKDTYRPSVLMGGIPSSKSKSKDRFREYASGGQMDNQLSSDSFQVQGNPNVTDGNHYPEQNINLDHNEVVDTKRNFVFSDDLKIGKKSFASMAVKPSKAIGKAEKALQSNPYDQQAKKTIEFSNRQLGTIATKQEELATLMGLRQPEQQNFAAGGTYQDPIKMAKIYNPFDPYSDPFNPYSPGIDIPLNMLEQPMASAAPATLGGVQTSPSGIPYPRKGRAGTKTAPTGLPNGPIDPNYRSSQQGYMDMLVKGNAGDYTPTAPMQPIDMLNRKSVTGQHNYFTEPDGTVRDLAELSDTIPTTVNSPIQISREARLPTLNTVDASKNPNDVSTNASSRDKMTLGDYLQFAEVGSKFFQTLRGPEVEKQILDNTRITKNNYDVKPQLQQSQRSYQNAVNNIDSPSLNLRRALTNNLYAGKLNADSQVITQYDNMNKQSNSQYEQQLSNQRRYNIQSTQYTNNLNAANRGAYDSVVQNAYTSVGNLGEALNRRKYGQDALKILSARYPDVYKGVVEELFGKKN